MREEVGVITTFYGYRGDLLEKIEKIIKVYNSIKIEPYIQLHSAPQNLSFNELVKRLRKFKDKSNVQYSIHQSMFVPDDAFYLNLGSSNEITWKESLDALKKSVDLAREIDARYLSFHAGYAANNARQEVEMEPVKIEEEISFPEAHANFRRGLNELLDYAEGYVEISVENCCYRPQIRNIFSKSEDFRYLSDRAKILFDVGHAYYSKNILNDNRYIDRILEERRISEIHISDNNGEEDHHQLIGYGTIPFMEIFKHLIKLQKLPPVLIEANKKRWEYKEKDLAKCIINLRNILKEVSEWEYKGRLNE